MEPSTAKHLPEPVLPSDLTEAERKFVNGEPRTPEETEAALQSLAARALASPAGYLVFCGVPDEDA